jgi:hypothetical protein
MTYREYFARKKLIDKIVGFHGYAVEDPLSHKGQDTIKFIKKEYRIVS